MFITCPAAKPVGPVGKFPRAKFIELSIEEKLIAVLVNETGTLV